MRTADSVWIAWRVRCEGTHVELTPMGVFSTKEKAVGVITKAVEASAAYDAQVMGDQSVRTQWEPPLFCTELPGEFYTTTAHKVGVEAAGWPGDGWGMQPQASMIPEDERIYPPPYVEPTDQGERDE